MTKTPTTPEKLSNAQIKVYAINTNYAHSLQLVEHWQKHLSPFIGKDIFKVDGSLKQKFENPERLTIEGKNDIFFYDSNAWLSKRGKSVDLTIKTCINGGSYDTKPATAFCQYETTTTEIFTVDEDDNLQPSTNNHDYLRKEYNVDELKAIAAEIKEAAEVYRKATEKMPYLFRDIFYIERLTRS